MLEVCPRMAYQMTFIPDRTVKRRIRITSVIEQSILLVSPDRNICPQNPARPAQERTARNLERDSLGQVRSTGLISPRGISRGEGLTRGHLPIRFIIPFDGQCFKWHGHLDMVFSEAEIWSIVIVKFQ
ncbi:hypothetical protein CEXT_641631 [Caerostris extrusa]|uniref:Uncharacterized protein n=1 Tax=Caerostris extrusa TaxID=172846 RepID=A0AAV4V3C6_CAEEX|nr:hypothetical protein CEXT_641631 [Caerostris extrusa]